MKALRNCFFVFTLTYLSLLTVIASDVVVRRISPVGGYCTKSVNSIIQDNYGYVWFATYNGVVRYNPDNTERFMYDSQNKTCLPSNIVNVLSCDNNNNIWAATNNGIARFDRDIHDFRKINYNYENGSLPNKIVYDIIIENDETLWVIDANYLGYLNIKTNVFSRIHLGANNKPTEMFKDKNDDIWIGSSDGCIYLLDKENKQAILKLDKEVRKVNTIYSDGNYLWISYYPDDFSKYAINESKNLEKCDVEFAGNETITSTIRQLFIDRSGRKWVGAFDGLYLIEDNEIIEVSADENESVIKNSIYEIFEDNIGGIWIGTWCGGVAYIHQDDNNFDYYHNDGQSNCINNGIISSFFEAPYDGIYVGTEKGGLNYFDKQNKSFTQIPLDNDHLFNVKCISVDKNEGLWVGTAFNGLKYRKKNETSFKNFGRYDKEGKSISGIGVFSLCCCDSGMWIAPSGRGLNFYSFKTKKIQTFRDVYPFSIIENYPVRSLYLDSRNNLWIGTLNGLFKLNSDQTQIQTFTTMSQGAHKTKVNQINYITELSDGNIYIGTNSDGINVYNPYTDSIYSYFADESFHNWDVFGIVESINKDIWVTTNNGIITISENKTRMFQFEDGLQSNIFNPGAILKDSDNLLYFGGTNGFNIFKNQDIRINSRPPNVLIESVKVNNTLLYPKQTGFNTYDNIILQPGENSISVNLMSDNYLLPQKNKFKYRLLNHYDEWSEPTYSTTATFVGLNAGDYTLEMVSSNNDGIWCTVPTILNFRIKQFWYKTWLAIFIYLSIVSFVALIIIRSSIARSRLAKELSIANIEREHHDELNEMKLRFFTNISHEFRTPLTLITLPVRKLLKSSGLSNEQIQQLETIKRNTNRLLQLINQIMDIRKVEKGKAKLNIINIDVTKLLNESALAFSEEVIDKRIDYKFHNQQSSIMIEGDVEKLDKVIYNILSNAFKFITEQGSITIHIEQTTNETGIISSFQNQLSYGSCDNIDIVRISITDNGPGINSDEMAKIFDRYHNNKSNKKIDSTGIGLSLCKEYTLMHHGRIVVQSTVGKGTSFIIDLPLEQNAEKVYYNSHNVIDNLKSWNPDNEAMNSKVPMPTNKKVHILIVEDNVELQSYVCELLEKYYTVLTANDGEEGLSMVKTEEVDIIISDVMMPKMDGFQLCKEVKTNLSTSHIPVVLLTALSSTDNTTTGLDYGADVYLSKPFDESLLLSHLKNILIQRKRLQKSYLKNYISHKPIELGDENNQFLKKINTIIEDNITNDQFSVELLSEKIGISRSQLHRKMKQMTNMTNSDYIMMVKIKKASELLIKGEHNIDEVSYMTGFNSHSYFSKCFKKIYNVTPKEYMIEHQNSY